MKLDSKFAKHRGESFGKAIAGKDVVIADAPQREKRRRRAPRIVFPDPDRDRKPKRIPALHFKTWEEWRASPYWGYDQVWRMQARFTAAREHARYGRRLASRTAAAAAEARPTAAAADVTVVPESANEAPPV